MFAKDVRPVPLADRLSIVSLEYDLDDMVAETRFTIDNEFNVYELDLPLPDGFSVGDSLDLYTIASLIEEAVTGESESASEDATDPSGMM